MSAEPEPETPVAETGTAVSGNAETATEADAKTAAEADAKTATETATEADAKTSTATEADAKTATEDRIAKSRARRTAAADDEEVTKLPRGKGFRVTRGQLVKIGLTAGLLVMLLVVQRPCSNAVGSFVTGFGDDPGSASSKMPKPGTVEPVKEQHYELLHPDMTEAELKAAVERAKRANGSANAGPEPKPEPKPESKTEPKPESKSDSKPEPKPAETTKGAPDGAPSKSK